MAQVNNTGLENILSVSDSEAHSVGLSIYEAPFLRNNEYMHDIATGYTLFGNQLTGNLYYQLHKNWRIQGGVYLRKDFGARGILTAEALITMKYQQRGYSFLVGNLEGQLSHRLLEPIFNYERYITNYNETGAQFKINRKKLWSDTWVNWEVMQYNRSPYQEEFVAGHHTQYHVVSTPKHKVRMDVQALVHHKGGQIDLDTNRVRSRVNTGFGAQYNLHSNRWIDQIVISQHLLLYHELSPSSYTKIKNGHGLFSQLSLHARPGITAALNYWKGENYLATHGGFLFQSQSSDYNQKPTYQKNRELLFFRWMYQKEVAPDIYMDIRFEPYYDLLNNYFEYAYAFYLIYKKDFTIGKLKYRQKK